jgi:hypothetical protein
VEALALASGASGVRLELGGGTKSSGRKIPTRSAEPRCHRPSATAVVSYLIIGGVDFSHFLLGNLTILTYI